MLSYERGALKLVSSELLAVLAAAPAGSDQDRSDDDRGQHDRGTGDKREQTPARLFQIETHCI